MLVEHEASRERFQAGGNRIRNALMTGGRRGVCGAREIQGRHIEFTCTPASRALLNICVYSLIHSRIPYGPYMLIMRKRELISSL